MKTSPYQNIVYFKLAKPMPLCPIGSEVFIHDADGRQHLRCNGIELPFDTAIKEPEWFIAVSRDEFNTNFKEAVVEYWMERGKTREEAKKYLFLL